MITISPSMTVDEMTRTRVSGGLSDEIYTSRWIDRVRFDCAVDERGCWLWTGAIFKKSGYGMTNFRRRTVVLHRQMYIVTHNIVLRRSDFVCHSCDVRKCCAPAHLWLGNNSLNQLDAAAKGRHAETKKTHCPFGHEYTPDNIYWQPRQNGKPPSRSCRLCNIARCRARRQTYTQGVIET